MTKLLAILALTLASACSGTWGGPTSRTMTTAYVGAVTMTALDVAGTVWASHGGAWDRVSPYDNGSKTTRMVETNLQTGLLGASPSEATLVTCAMATAVIAFLVHESPLPGWAKWTGVAILGSVESYAVINNYPRVGIAGIGANEHGFVQR